MAITPAQVFAALLSDPDQENNRRCRPERRRSKSPAAGGEREVQVSASAEVSAPPNRARLCVMVASKKETAAAAKGSVNRRLDYIVQSVRGHGVREDSVTVTKDFRRVENAYQMEAEVCVIFGDFGKMEDLCNLLVEKLDSSVIVGSPQFYHTTEAVESIRRQACLRAVANSRRKAFEVCRLLGQTLGRPLIIREEETRESEGLASEAPTPDNTRPLTVQQQISNASHITSNQGNMELMAACGNRHQNLWKQKVIDAVFGHMHNYEANDIFVQQSVSPNLFQPFHFSIS